MNLDTSEIKEFGTEEELQEAIRTGNWIRIRCLPDPKCETCKGKGNKGIDSNSGLYIPCGCISYNNYLAKKLGFIQDEEEEKALGEVFKKLLKKRLGNEL